MTDWSGYWAPTSSSPHCSRRHRARPIGRPLAAAQFIADNQNDDGTWPNADLFHALESLLAVNSRGAEGDQRAAPVLIAQQRRTAPSPTAGGTADRAGVEGVEITPPPAPPTTPPPPRPYPTNAPSLRPSRTEARRLRIATAASTA
jgi:hypothetical protein